MRTTLDLPDDLLDIARSLARGRKQSLGQAVADLMRRGLNPPEPPRITTSSITGLPVISFGGGPITLEQVATWEDDETDRYLESVNQARADDGVA